MTAETQANVRLTPERRQLLSRLCPTMFEEPETLVRDGDGWRTDRTGRTFSRHVIVSARRAGLLSEAGAATERGVLLYQHWLRDNSGIGAHD